MRRIPGRLVCTLLFFVMTTAASSAHARQITDMTGKKVTVPDKITKVYSTSPPGTYLLYAVDPALVAGLNFAPNEQEKKFIRKEFQQLPVIGGTVGQGRNLNIETLLKMKPDVILLWASQDQGIDRKYEETFNKLGLPTVRIRLDSLADYPDTFHFLGELLDRRERAATLQGYAERSLREIAAVTARIPARERVSVYYAEGPDGLATERESSLHAQLINLAGGRNVHRGEALDHFGMEQVAMEQVMLYNPRVILAQERSFFSKVRSDQRWQGIRAVKEKRVYQIPKIPFNWFDRPPSFMRLLGLKWLTNTLYPQRYPLNLVRETREFYRLFLGIALSDDDMREVLGL